MEKHKDNLTFALLKEEVQGTTGKLIPTPKALMMGGAACIAEKEMADGSRLMAFENGFALFQTSSRYTVLRIDDCKDYTYYTRTNTHYFSEDYFDDKPWHLRLQLEAEDRMQHNQQVREDEARIEKRLAGKLPTYLSDCLDDLVLKEELAELFSMLTDRQRRVIQLHYLLGYKQTRIAEITGTTQPAIARVLAQAKKKLKKKYE